MLISLVALLGDSHPIAVDVDFARSKLQSELPAELNGVRGMLRYWFDQHGRAVLDFRSSRLRAQLWRSAEEEVSGTTGVNLGRESYSNPRVIWLEYGTDQFEHAKLFVLDSKAWTARHTYPDFMINSPNVFDNAESGIFLEAMPAHYVDASKSGPKYGRVEAVRTIRFDRRSGAFMVHGNWRLEQH